MDRQTEQVFKGFLGLNPKQKKDLIDAINEYLGQTEIVKKELEEAYKRKAILGPLASEVCKCCGR